MGEAIKFGRGKLELYQPKFAGNDWSKIISACQRGSVPDTWKVGDQKAMTINGKDYLIDIIGKSHDEYADGSGYAPLTFQMHGTYATPYAWNTENDNSCGWINSTIRNTHLPTILLAMPSDVQAAVREVNKKTSAGNASSTIIATADKLFLLSEIEIFGSCTWSFSGEGSQYEYYAAGGSKAKNDGTGTAAWGERSPNKNNSMLFCAVNGNGEPNYGWANGAHGVVPAFCF